MFDSEFNLLRQKQSYVRELFTQLRKRRYEPTDDGRIFVRESKLIVGGGFPTQIWRHKSIHKAMEEHDHEKAAYLRNWVKSMGFHRTRRDYIPVSAEFATNLIPDAALTNLLGVWLGVVAKKTAWYLAPFSSDSTPAAAWASDWGKAAGGQATEFTDYDETNRQAWSRDAAANKSITNSTKTDFTVSAGVTDESIYGMTLNSIATQQYAVADQVLVAASRYGTAKVVNATDVMSVGYTITASSS